jgi:signal transduction histidine kinase/streptogramin lyase
MQIRIPWCGSIVGLGLLLITSAPGTAGTAGTAKPSFSSDDYVVQLWNVDSGLPQSSVMSIVQTPDGYLWVGTLQGGLARFDGSRFVTFDPANTPELKSIEMRRLLVDPEGTLWIGTVEGGLTSYRDGAFHFEGQSLQTAPLGLQELVSYHRRDIVLRSAYGWLSRGTQEGQTHRWETYPMPGADSQSEACEAADGIIWYRTATGCLAQMRGTNATVWADPPGLRSSRINAVFKDRLGNLGVGTEEELAVWRDGAFADMTPTNSEGHLAVRKVAPCKDGAFWVLTEDKLRKCMGRRWVAEADWRGTDPIPPLSELVLYADSRGGLWAAHPKGLYHIDGEGHVVRVGSQQGLPSELLECWFEDREGNLWLGLRDSGLACVRLRVVHTVWPMDKLGGKSAHSVCEDDDGAMWFGLAEQKLLCLRDGVFTSTTLNSSDVTVLPDGPNRLWVGMVGDGLWLREGDRLERAVASADIGPSVRCLLKDRAGALWIGSEFGLFRWDEGVLRSFKPADGFPAAYVLSLAEDSAGAIWVGTATGELWRWQAGRFECFRPQDSPGGTNLVRAEFEVDPTELRKRGALSVGERFWALHFDAEGVLWIGTLSGGVLRFDQGRFTRFTTRHGLPNENVSQILEDDRGQFWFGTRAGIVRVARRDLNEFARGSTNPITFVTYGRFDGMPTLECSGGNQPNCWKSRDGRLWFTTVKGAVWVDPSALRFNHLPPPVQISEVLVDGSRVPDRAGAPARPGGRVPAQVRIAAGRHYLEFAFSGLSFTAPDKVKFKWWLKGLDPNWVDGGGRRTVNYSFIPPGDYQFEVRACNNDGVWSESCATVALIVLPYFWQTWWFRVAVALLLAAALWTAYRIRIGRLRALEELRLRIARDLHDEVGANLGSISLLSQLMEQSPSSSDAAQLRAIAIQTIDTLREIIWVIDPAHDKLDDLVARLHETSRVMLPAIECKFLQSGDFSSVELSLAFRRNVLPLYKEVLHNLLKHSRATTVEISVSCQNKQFQFRIRDNGVGFDPARKSAGNGLKNMRRRAAELRGRLEIDSRCGDGTMVTLTAPIT